MLQKAKKLDLFGQRPALRMGGSSTHKTWCGFVCTLYVILACIISAIYYFQQFFDRSTLTYIFTEAYDADESTSLLNYSKSLTISQNKFFLMVAITEIATLASPQLFKSNTPLLTSFPISFSFKDSTHSMTLPAAACDTLSYFQDILSNPEMQNMPNMQQVLAFPTKFVCLESMSIDFINELRSSLEISIGCSVSGCDSLDNKSFLIVASDYLLSISNFSNPLIQNAASYRYQINKNQYSIIDLALQKVRVTTDSGYLLEHLHFEDQLAIENVEYYNTPRGSSTDPQLLLRISPFHKRLTYQRYYPKLLVLVGLIGGILKSLMVLGTFVTKPFSKLSMRTELVNQLFTFEIKSDHGNNKPNYARTIKEPQPLPKDKAQQIHKQSYDSALKHHPKQDQEESDCIQELEDNIEYFHNSNHQQPSNLINPTAYTNGNGLKLITNALIPQELASQRPFLKSLHNKELDSVMELEEFGASEMYIPSPMKVPVLYSPLIGLTSTSKNSSSIPLESYRLSKIDQGTKSSSQKQLSPNQILNCSETTKQLKSLQDCLQTEGILLSGQINTLTGDTGNFDQTESEDPEKPSESENFNHKQSSSNTDNTTGNKQKETDKQQSNTDVVGTQSNIQIIEKDLFPSFNKLQLMPVDNSKTQQSNSNLPFQFKIPLATEPETIAPLMKLSFQQHQKTIQSNDKDNNHPKANQIHSDIENKVEMRKLDQQNSFQSDKDMKLSQASQKIKTFFSQKSKEITELIRLNILSKNPSQCPSGKEFEDPSSTNAELDPKKKILNQQLSFRKKSTHDQFEGIISEKQKKSIVLRFKDYLNYFLVCFKRTPKVQQMKYTNRKVKKRLDLIYILQKLTEIDKLKVLLLNPDQINLFDYMPREFVQRKDPIFEKNSLSDLTSQKNNRFATWSLLCAEKTSLDMYSNACIAYHHIKQKREKTKLDSKLIEMLDPQVKRYFMETQIQPDQLQNYAYMLASQSHQGDETTKHQRFNARGFSDQVQGVSNNFSQNTLGRDTGQTNQLKSQESQQNQLQSRKKSYFGRQGSDYNISLPELKQFNSSKPQLQLGQLVESQCGNSEDSALKSNQSQISQGPSLRQIDDISDNIHRIEISFSAVSLADENEEEEIKEQTNLPPSVTNTNSNNLRNKYNIRKPINQPPFLVNPLHKSREIQETKKDFFTFDLDHVCVSSNNIESQDVSQNNIIQHQQQQEKNVQNQEIIPPIPLNISQPFSNSQQDHQLKSNKD